MNQQNKPTVIVGGGFTGLFTALHLKHRNYSRPVVLIDQKDRFTFQPLLYEYFSREMNTDQVCPRYVDLLEGNGITFVHGYIDEIDLLNRQIRLESDGDYDYEYLVLALGSVVNYFGIDGAEEFSWPFRTQNDAFELSTHIRDCLQQASRMDNSAERQKLLTFALMGGGPSGVELAGTLGDLLPKWYADLGGDPREIRLILFEQLPDLLQGDINNPVRDTAREALRQRTVPVDVKLEHTVTAVEPDCVRFKHNDQADTLPTATMIWTAGVTTHPLMKALPLNQEQRDKKDRPLVTSTLQLPDFPDVFAGGDCAAEQEDILPPLAQVAYQQGKTIAHNLDALEHGKELAAADVNLRGSLLKLGLGDSVAHLFNRFEISGTAGHLIRQGTYLELLPSAKHNVKATAEWFLEELFQRHTRSQSTVK